MKNYSDGLKWERFLFGCGSAQKCVFGALPSMGITNVMASGKAISNSLLLLLVAAILASIVAKLQTFEKKNFAFQSKSADTQIRRPSFTLLD
jgi:hypothetical protein